MSRIALTLCLILVGTTTSHAQWRKQTIRTEADFRGLCAVDAKVAWVSGTGGTYGRTGDGGRTWQVGTVPDAARLDFRDVEAFDDKIAYLLDAGPGTESRIYKTLDGGKTWKMQFKNDDPEAFYDAIAFWDEKHGIAMGDPVKGQFQLLVTDDGGVNWKRIEKLELPAAIAGEGAYAASGTSLITRGEKDAWFVTGGGKTARAFHSADRGRTWVVHDTPLVTSNESSGIFSIAFRDEKNGVIVGGDFRKPNASGATVAVTEDGGKSWRVIENQMPFRSCVAWAKDRWIAVGTSGSHASQDQGATWKPIDKEIYNSVAFAKTGEGWAVGPKGRVAVFTKKPE